jgi:hypothetical protein
MDEQTRLRVELALEDRLRADLGTLSVRPYSYYREAAMQRIPAKPGYVGRVFTFVRVGATLVVAALFALAAAFILLNLRGPSPAASPTPVPAVSTTPTARPSATPTPSPAATVTPVAPPFAHEAASAEQLAIALKLALESSDYASIADLVSPAGWTAGFYQSEGTPHMSPQETVDLLRTRAKDGRLNVTVEPQPLLPHQDYQPLGDLYVRSIWRDFGTVAEQNVDLVLRNDGGGRWFWSGALFRAPR